MTYIITYYINLNSLQKPSSKSQTRVGGQSPILKETKIKQKISNYIFYSVLVINFILLSSIEISPLYP